MANADRGTGQMALTAGEHRTLAEIARRLTAEDPELGRRLSAFGGYETSVLGMPSRWTLVPVALVGALLVGAFLVMSVVSAGRPASGTSADDRSGASSCIGYPAQALAGNCRD
ncbi:DUF3040 domain-containing protein [Actinomadura logoneensis]|uniref:DUF3040 domain-containing protein n=1 Tax=Actinomadura logoneensis TaxID=2293572 RepID=A0A372JDC6_9ACTN|nr:DUF3040 domain-containing protein [Actinomadura logoneensis]RFU38011.1 DUF3040 domain-containing protein [Actinomadura logoneensis]